MKTETLFHVVFEDGTELRGLTFDEADKAMEEGENNGNNWIRVYPEPRD